jgi:hypothetical protein
MRKAAGDAATPAAHPDVPADARMVNNHCIGILGRQVPADRVEPRRLSRPPATPSTSAGHLRRLRLRRLRLRRLSASFTATAGHGGTAHLTAAYAGVTLNVTLVVGGS